MTPEENKIMRDNLKRKRELLLDIVSNIDSEIKSLCHYFSEDDLLINGWIRGNFSGPYMAYEYNKGKKILIFREKDGEVLTYGGAQTKVIEDIQELIKYGK